jgi:hypothetical protein
VAPTKKVRAVRRKVGQAGRPAAPGMQGRIGTTLRQPPRRNDCSAPPGHRTTPADAQTPTTRQEGFVLPRVHRQRRRSLTLTDSTPVYISHAVQCSAVRSLLPASCFSGVVNGIYLTPSSGSVCTPPPSSSLLTAKICCFPPSVQPGSASMQMIILPG